MALTVITAPWGMAVLPLPGSKYQMPSPSVTARFSSAFCTLPFASVQEAYKTSLFDLVFE